MACSYEPMLLHNFITDGEIHKDGLHSLVTSANYNKCSYQVTYSSSRVSYDFLAYSSAAGDILY